MYNHNSIEKKWEKYWEDKHTYKFVDDPSKPKFYVLDMFPYPSGKGLHVGHPKGYTGTDVLSRYKRLNGFNVLHPIGWDAFGLPAEQYALKTNNHPEIFTYENIANFRSQLKRLGFDFDYTKEVNTTDPAYFQWTQWIFIQLYKQGLAEIKEIDVNWCPQLGTVLANEEVVLNKAGERVSEVGGFPVVKKPMRQWVLKITEYADKLIEGLEEINWPNSLKSLQQNWIGRTIGIEVDFKLKDCEDKLKIFTSRPDTIYGVSYLAVSPAHPLLNKLVTNDNKDAIDNYVKEYNELTDRDIKINKTKSGLFTGSYAIHPLTNEVLPIYVTNYVLSTVGVGAIMGVPAHDENDFEFAKLMDLPIIAVIDTKEPLPYLGDGKHINSDFLNGLNNAEAFKLMSDKLVALGIGTPKTHYKLRDWIFSRQRYWGEPFPVLFDENLKVILDEELPILLPKLKEFKPSGNGESPLLNAKDWLEVDKDGQKYIRDTNTMPQWAGSCWYYLGYILKNNDDQTYLPLNSQEAKERFKRWLPVDVYVGGQEHAVLHLLYARFWHRFLYDIGIVPTKEPFYTLVNQGIILGPDNEKMSKSKGNIISVDEVLDSHGADALRLYEMFMGPFTSSMSWKNEALDGVRKWLERVYRLYTTYESLGFIKETIKSNNQDLLVAYNKMVKSVGTNIEKFQFNLAISDMMIFINEVYKQKVFNVEIMHNFLIILSCFAPHLAEELNELQGSKPSITLLAWPQYDPNLVIEQTVSVPVVINKKPKDVLNVPVDTPEDKLLELALALPKVQQIINGQPLKKTIVIKNKIVNIIL